MKVKERDLFSVKSGEKLKLKKRKRDKNRQSDEPYTKKPKKEKELKLEFEYISYANIAEGQLILGCIQEVRKYEMILSLPDGMKGYLPITNISRSYRELLSKVSEGAEISETVHSLNELYSVGHLIITKVKNIIQLPKNLIKVILSILPEDVNLELTQRQLVKGVLLQGAVTSVEEKGYVIDVGIRSVRAAFLKNKEVSPVVVGIGSVFLCVIKKVLELDHDWEGIRIKLSAKPEHMSSSVEGNGVVAVLPGVIVDAVVETVLPNGLELSIQDRKGFVNLGHLLKTNDLTANYQVGQKVQARVLYVTDFTSIAYCTLNPNLCRGGVIHHPMCDLKIGDVIDDAEIYKSTVQGVHLLLPRCCHGFCPVSMLREPSTTVKKEITASFPVGSRKICRIMRVNLLDQLFIVSLRKSILSEKVFAGEDLIIGQTLKVKILQYKDVGVVVAISNHVKGFVTSLHLTDASERNLEHKYPLGQTFKAKIIRHTPGDDPHLTLKSDLLHSNLPIVTTFDESNVGVVTAGCIAKICNNGLLLEFYNNAKAFAPRVKIPSELRDLPNAFRKGQVVKCKIVSVYSSKRKMVASLDLVKPNPSRKKLTPGDVVNCKVTSIKEEKVFVSIDGKDIWAYIPFHHLADDVDLSKSLSGLLQEGDIIQEAVVFSKLNFAFILSIKPSVFQHIQNQKGRMNETLKSGDILPSVVVEIGEDYVHVSTVKKRFGSKIRIMKRNLMKENFKKISYTSLQIGQTLFVQYLKKDDATGLSKGTSHLSKVIENKQLSSLQLLYNTIATEKQIQAALKKVQDAKFSKVKIGKMYPGEVKAITQTGALVNISSLGLDGVIHPEHLSENPPKLNGTVMVRVMCINYKNNCLELTARKKLKLCASNRHKIEVGQEYGCKVLLAKREFILGQLGKPSMGQIVYMPAKRHINDFHGRHSFYKIGKNYLVKIRYVEDNLILADLLDHCQTSETSAEPLNLHTEMAKICIVNPIPLSAVSPLTLNESTYTHSDFIKRAKQKIMQVSQFVEMKRSLKKKQTGPLSKLAALKRDNFPQFDEELYWNYVALGRKEKQKKLKKNGMKVPKHTKEKKLYFTEDGEDDSPMRRESVTVNSNAINEDLSEDDGDDVPPAETTDCLQIKSNGFDWSGEALADEASSSSEETSNEMESATPWKSVKRLSKFERDERARAEERKTRQLELQRLDPDRPPETALDYEEKVEKKPHSSALWIEYISFHLENAETEKARMVAERALKRIPPSMEGERLAIWNVILRLEVMFGSPQSVQDAFKEAITTNDELKVFYLMIDIYANATKIKEGEEVIQLMTKKYPQSSEVWIKAGLFYFKAKELTAARKILERSLISLPKREHIDIINRFAQFELKFGDQERGKTIFEKLLCNFPKRLDVWNVYADCLRKNNDIPGTRNVLERMTGLKLRMKPMRSVFKKLLEFEKEHGTPQMVEAVKVMVEKYVAMALKEEEQ